MYLVRDIMYCKPGKVRPMIEKYKAMGKLSEKAGWGKWRVMTDVVAERYWTIIAEMEVPSMDAFMQMDMGSEEAKEMEQIMKGYHDYVDHGKREVYKIEE